MPPLHRRTWSQILARRAHPRTLVVQPDTPQRNWHDVTPSLHTTQADAGQLACVWLHRHSKNGDGQNVHTRPKLAPRNPPECTINIFSASHDLCQLCCDKTVSSVARRWGQVMILSLTSDGL
jgi:hypothetical protein